MRVLITGGNGYIGHYLVNALKECGTEVFITSRNAKGNDCRHMELLDTSTIAGICHGVGEVVHLANLDERLVKQQSREALLANSYATRELYLDAVREGVKKFIYFSTFHVYGCNSGNIDEDTVPKPQTDYGLTHYFAEQYLEQLSASADVPVAVIRLTNGIGAPQGPYKWYLALNDFCRSSYEKNRIVLKSNGLPQRDFVPIRDVVSAVDLLLKTEQSSSFEVYNVSSESTYSIRDLAIATAEAYRTRYGKTVQLDIPAATQAEIDAVKPLYVSSRKIRQLGWKQEVTLNDVIHDIFDVLEKGVKNDINRTPRKT